MTGPNQPLIDRFAAPPARGGGKSSMFSRVLSPVGCLIVIMVFVLLVAVAGLAFLNSERQPENLSTMAATRCAKSGADAVMLFEVYWFECEP